MSDLDEAYQLDYFEEAGFHRQECGELRTARQVDGIPGIQR